MTTTVINHIHNHYYCPHTAQTVPASVDVEPLNSEIAALKEELADINVAFDYSRRDVDSLSANNAQLQKQLADSAAAVIDTVCSRDKLLGDFQLAASQLEHAKTEALSLQLRARQLEAEAWDSLDKQNKLLEEFIKVRAELEELRPDTDKGVMKLQAKLIGDWLMQQPDVDHARVAAEFCMSDEDAEIHARSLLVDFRKAKKRPRDDEKDP
jgi:ATP-dependent Clp protease ATP-binding subunit ClpA